MNNNMILKQQQQISSSISLRKFFSAKILAPLFFSIVMISSNSFCNELSLNGIVPAVNNVNDYGWTFGIPVGGYMTDNNIDIYAGYWEPIIMNGELYPQIATNALIFPEKYSIIAESKWTNIIWDVEKITDVIDGTNLTISKIHLHYADTTNFILEVTNNIANTLGEIEWYIPPGSWAGETNYVLKFEVVNSSSLTNSRIFWGNKFTIAIVPEAMGIIMLLTLSVPLWLLRNRH